MFKYYTCSITIHVKVLYMFNYYTLDNIINYGHKYLEKRLARTLIKLKSTQR